MHLNRRTLLAASTAFFVLPTTGSFAEGHAAHVIQMLNKHPEDSKLRMVYYPRVLRVKAGDTVLFESTDRGHNTQSIDGMIPDGAEEWNSKINDNAEVTFNTPGVYGYKCTPHAATGMVGLIIVEGEGMLDNLEAAKGVRQRGRAKAVFEDLWEEAEAGGYLDAPEA